MSTGPAVRLFTCRECKDIIYTGAHMVCRDGRKTRLHCHAQCFSGRPFYFFSLFSSTQCSCFFLETTG